LSEEVCPLLGADFFASRDEKDLRPPGGNPGRKHAPGMFAIRFVPRAVPAKPGAGGAIRRTVRRRIARLAASSNLAAPNRTRSSGFRLGQRFFVLIAIRADRSFKNDFRGGFYTSGKYLVSLLFPWYY